MSEASFQSSTNVPQLPLLTSRGHSILATAAKELTAEARDGVRSGHVHLSGRRTSGPGLSLDFDGPRRFSQTATSPWTSRSEAPGDIMTSGPQTLVVAASRGRRKGMHTGVNSARLPLEERLDHELKTISEQIGMKAAQKFSTVRQAFRYLDADHDGKISRSEMQYFFRAYNFTSDIADRFFSHLDKDGSGEVEYTEFMKYVAPHVQPSQNESSQPPSECCSSASTRAPSPLPLAVSEKSVGPEIQTMLEFIGKKSKEKYHHAREVFRLVDCNDDGSISRKEMRYFFLVFNMPEESADKVFDHLGGDVAAELNYYEFVRFLGPFLDLPGTEAAMGQRPDGQHSWMLQRPEGQPPSNRPSRRSSLAASRRSSLTPSIADSSHPVEATELSHTQLEKEMREVMKDIGEKLPLKFKHVRDAFRPLDLSHNGRITKVEMRSFLRGFGWSPEVADRFFGALDEEGIGNIDFNTFMAHFDDVLGPANRPATRGDLVDVANCRLRQEVNQIAAVLSEKLLTKFSSAREALRTLNLHNDGKITLQEMQLFFRTMCMSPDAANNLFKALCKDGAEYVEYTDFLALFGPVYHGGGSWRTVQHLKATPRLSGPAAWTIA